MPLLDAFKEISLLDEPLAPYTWMKIGGPAQFLVRPRNPDELLEVVRYCHEEQIPVRMLGGGSNVLVRDEGVSGAVVQLIGDAFGQVSVDGTSVQAGAGAALSHLIAESVKAELAGLETLSGIPGSVGGAIRGNAGGRSGDIGQFVDSVTVMSAQGEISTRRGNDLWFGYRESNIDELVILEGTFSLQPADPQEITRRMRKLWIMKKATQPLSFQSAGCIFKNPRGLSAGSLIEQAGLKGIRVGQAEISDRHANFIVTHPNAKSDDVMRLIDLARSKVSEQFGVDLELEIKIW
ncbi:MAG TPA: UDP-N-acetylmuramate dehydrogenase [Planctomycetaceae bacterium]|jgi:UDP-N-acetylmuramate dehydrogenase|nr:UDP-N-acetylmuramate dehydrogenase [Planctomycetaceae bacterium]